MFKRVLPVFLLCLFASGCNSYAPEELDRLTKEDPNFKQLILARDRAHVQIASIKGDLLAKKKVMDMQIDKLRRDYDAYAKVQNLKAEKIGSTIEASRNSLKKEIETMGAQLAAKENELEGYEKTLADVKRVIGESKGIKFSAQEKQKWEERILMLSEKIGPLSDDIQDLKLQIRLKKQKIGFLK